TRSSPCSRCAPTCAASTDYRRASGTLGATPSIGSGVRPRRCPPLQYYQDRSTRPDRIRPLD
ncbi:hypothetical protein L210DRAFT_3557212, partial [Boletus edulis BED1]